MSYSFERVFNPNPGWYRGDFHVHTTASDGDYPPSVVAEIAKAEGLDFIAITDHNSITGLTELRDDLDFLIIPGLEVTFKKGHFNALDLGLGAAWTERICVNKGTRILPSHYQTINQLLQEAVEYGHLNSINHPLLHPWEWNFNDTDLRTIHCLELWNDLYYPDNVIANPQAVDMWSKWLNAGHRITAIGGSDYHYPPRPEENKAGERLGYPATFVYADELSVAGIIAGLRQRRAYVSKGPQVSFEAEINGKIFGIGADVGEREGKITFSATLLWKPKIIQVQLVKNGQVITEAKVKGKKAEISFSDIIDENTPAWYRLDVSDVNGQKLAITNPIFAGMRRESKLFMYGDFV